MCWQFSKPNYIKKWNDLFLSFTKSIIKNMLISCQATLMTSFFYDHYYGCHKFSHPIQILIFFLFLFFFILTKKCRRPVKRVQYTSLLCAANDCVSFIFWTFTFHKMKKKTTVIWAARRCPAIYAHYFTVC